MKKIIIIGAGASGVLCSIYLKKMINDIEVIVLEQNSSPLKKLLATGNGRCNLSHKNITIDSYCGESIEKIKPILYYDIVEEFKKLGILTKYQGELLYPRSEQALTVKNCLYDEAINNGVLFIFDQEVQKIDYQRSLIYTSKQRFHYDDIIFAMGSPAGKLSGQTFERYQIFKNLKLKVNPLMPSLVQMKTRPVLSCLKGVRVKGTFSLKCKNEIHQQVGEMLFTNDGVSGIAIMQLSRYFNNEPMILEIDMFDDYSEDELYELIEQRLKEEHQHFYEGLVNTKIAAYLEKKDLRSTKDIVKVLKHFQLQVIGLRNINYAQVLKGGLSLNEVDDDLQIKKYPHLYAIGEVLDVAGDCGGYNLHFAFASAYWVAKAIERRYYDQNNEC